VTAAHVVDECNTVSIRHKHKEMHGQVVAIDSNNDLGLIKLDEKFTASGRLRDGKPINLGGMVANYGYPLFGQLSDAAKVTQGNINALAGWENDSSIFQFDAPTQPGNSGGPLLDNSGNIVALVSSGLSKDYAINSDHIAQNVNFAVKSYLIEGFLTANGVTYEKAESTELLELPDIAEKAETFTVLVGCWE
jgi:serine protease Do